MIQSASPIPKQVAGEIICSRRRRYSFYRFTTHYEGFCDWVTFITMTVDFHKMETIHFNIICQLTSLLGMKEINSALYSIFNHHFRVLHFEYFSTCVVGTSQTCYHASTICTPKKSLHGIPFKQLQKYKVI
jgi:hypothetical protein